MWNIVIKGQQMGAVRSSSVAKTIGCNVAKTKEACSAHRGFILAVYGQGWYSYH